MGSVFGAVYLWYLGGLLRAALVYGRLAGCQTEADRGCPQQPVLILEAWDRASKENINVP